MPNSLASPNPWLLQIKGRQHAGQEIFTGRKKQLHKDRDVHFLFSDYFWRLQALLTNYRLKCLLLQKKKKFEEQR